MHDVFRRESVPPTVRRRLCVLLFLLFGLVMRPDAANAAETTFPAPVDGEIVAENVYVRQDHDNKSKRIATLEEASVVSALAEWKGDQKLPWYKVRTNGVEGWVYGQFFRRLDGDAPVAHDNPVKSAATPAPHPSIDASQSETTGIVSADKQGFVVVESEGKGPDRQAAIEQAWLDAIRYAVGMMIEAKTEIDSRQISEKVVAHSRGVVEKYEVLMADDSRASQGVYAVRLKCWVRRDLLRDGLEYVAKGGQVVSFSMNDLKPKDALDANKAEGMDAKGALKQRQAKDGVELIRGVLQKYKPVDFLSIRFASKLRPVKDKKDTFEIDMEVAFSEDLYYNSYVPDIMRVLDQVSTSKKREFYREQWAINDIRNIYKEEGNSLGFSIESAFQTNTIPSVRKVNNNFPENTPDFWTLPDKPKTFSYLVYSLSPELGDEAAKADIWPKPQKDYSYTLVMFDASNNEVFRVEKTVSVAISSVFSYSRGSGVGRERVSTIFNCPSMIFDNYYECIRRRFTVSFTLPEEILPQVKSIKVEGLR